MASIGWSASMTSTASAIFKDPSVTSARRILYLVTPNETSFSRVEDVPGYVNEAVPLMLICILLESCLRWLRGKSCARVNDGMSSLAAGIFSEFNRVIAPGVDVVAYCYIWSRLRLVELPWQEPSTWWSCLLAVDFAYYWFHRASHEVSIIWAAHQVHHSSEDYNLNTALRQSVMQIYASWLFYLPLALFLPPQIFVVHRQLNLLYQFWIHTELIGKLPRIVELILNTPSHHRVHHGSNPKYINKNYGGTLIIWDRMFGTFTAEEDEVVYGLTHQVNSFEPFTIQFHQFLDTFRTSWNIPGIKNKLGILFCGPGWVPGTGRLGPPIDETAEVVWPQKYDRRLPTWLTVYLVLQFAMTAAAFQLISEIKQALPFWLQLVCCSSMLFTLVTIGLFYDYRYSAPKVEMVRCLVLTVGAAILKKAVALPGFGGHLYNAFQVTFVLLTCFWVIYCSKIRDLQGVDKVDSRSLDANEASRRTAEVPARRKSNLRAPRVRSKSCENHDESSNLASQARPSLQDESEVRKRVPKTSQIPVFTRRGSNAKSVNGNSAKF